MDAKETLQTISERMQDTDESIEDVEYTLELIRDDIRSYFVQQSCVK